MTMNFREYEETIKNTPSERAPLPDAINWKMSITGAP